MLLVQEWEEARRSFLEAVAEGRAGAGVEAGSHIHPFPAHSKSPTWHLSKALDVQASPTADDPAEVAKPKCCPPGELREGSLSTAGREAVSNTCLHLIKA